MGRVIARDADASERFLCCVGTSLSDRVTPRAETETLARLGGATADDRRQTPFAFASTGERFN